MSAESKRIFGLDVLRSFAILFVIYGHGTLLLADYGDRNLMRLGSLDGVSIFFVLSGFLIGRIFIQQLEKGNSSRADLFRFWKRRWFRTLPNYYLILGVLSVYYLLNTRADFSTLAPFAIFAQNLAFPHPPFFTEAWSLAVEEWFYLTIPLLLWILVGAVKLKPRTALLLVITLVLMLSMSWRVYKYADFNYVLTLQEWGLWFRKPVVSRLDSIIFGVIGAYASFYLPSRWMRRPKLKFVLGILLLIASKWTAHIMVVNNRVSAFDALFGFYLITLGTLLLLPLLMQWKTQNSWWAPFFTWTSIISYSMYLIHLSGVLKIGIGKTMLNQLPGHIQFVIYVIAVFGISHFLYRWFEKPTTALRDRF